MVVRLSRPGSAKQQRRAATAIEYLFCASLILVVCIAGFQSVAGMLKRSSTDSAQKIEKAIK